MQDGSHLGQWATSSKPAKLLGEPAFGAAGQPRMPGRVAAFRWMRPT
jgi:hypothetical protein